MKIEVLYFKECPNHIPAMEMVRTALESLGRNDQFDEVEVRSQAEAETIRFVGSPSIRIEVLRQPWLRIPKKFSTRIEIVCLLPLNSKAATS